MHLLAKVIHSLAKVIHLFTTIWQMIHLLTTIWNFVTCWTWECARAWLICIYGISLILTSNRWQNCRWSSMNVSLGPRCIVWVTYEYISVFIHGYIMYASKAHIFVWICIHMNKYSYEYIFIWIYIHLNIYSYDYIFLWIYIHMNIYLYIHTWVYHVSLKASLSMSHMCTYHLRASLHHTGHIWGGYD